MPSPHAETTVDKNKQLVNTVSQSPKASTPMRLQEPSGLKQSIQPSVHVNRYKLDNRPTAFRIIPPLPVGLANVSLLTLSCVSLFIERILQWLRLFVLLVLIPSYLTKSSPVGVGRAHAPTHENSRHWIRF
jgi:hypothetical protein